MAGRTRTLRIRAMTPTLLASMLIACQPGTSDGPKEEPPLRREVVASIAANVIEPTLAAFATEASALETAVAAWAAAPADEAALESARSAWRSSMLVWQRAELMQVGPAAVATDAVGGQDLRDEIYSWPLSNACRIDQHLVTGGFGEADVLGAEPTNVRGLDAIEYLLFHPEGNECAPNATINREGTWAALEAEELVQRRARYAAAAAAHVRRQADTLRDAWSGGFTEAIANAGRGDSPYRTVAEALNAISDAMFYLEKETKDLKLMPPLGLRDCADAPCPELLESRWSHHSLENIAANIAAFEALYRGGDGTGFDDLLTDIGATEVATQMDALLVSANAAVASTPGPLDETLVTDPEAVRILHDAVKSVVDLLKTQFVGVLDLEIPQRAEGDND